MTLQQRINAFAHVGDVFRAIVQQKEHPAKEVLLAQIDRATAANAWFTKENIYFCLEQWSQALTADNLTQWVKSYSLNNDSPQKVGIIMAGNIPLVGFHDLLAVVLSGNIALAKLSSNDQRLIPAVREILIGFDPASAEAIQIVQHKLTDFDAVIATGSNNTARYFEYYFKDKPSIIRKNRNAVAVLTGEETNADLKALGEDIFRYYGLGCRNVSKVYVPTGYNFNSLFESLYEWNSIINHHKYANNYDYNKAVYLMSQAKLLDNNFFLIKQDTALSSPIGVLFYEEYGDLNDVNEIITARQEEIQCVVSKAELPNALAFGEAQQPRLWDYADGVDTLAFLSTLPVNN
ncbi:acyl-CoA reductase [Gangjinia marincola]|uniref:Acyl-CoA reductase n=1 Tax=Gangjinia marincola TaxID=578463 RepID=A0ABP3XNZ0_9FLAO